MWQNKTVASFVQLLDIFIYYFFQQTALRPQQQFILYMRKDEFERGVMILKCTVWTSFDLKNSSDESNRVRRTDYLLDQIN